MVYLSCPDCLDPTSKCHSCDQCSLNKTVCDKNIGGSGCRSCRRRGTVCTRKIPKLIRMIQDSFENGWFPYNVDIDTRIDREPKFDDAELLEFIQEYGF